MVALLESVTLACILLLVVRAVAGFMKFQRSTLTFVPLAIGADALKPDILNSPLL